MRKLLLVDDEPDVLRIGQLSLGALGGWTVLVAANAEDALRLARHERPQLILLDVVMAPVDGLEVFASLKRDPQTAKIPIVLITVRPHDADVRRLGAEGIIAKPFDPLTLASQISRFIDAA